jgi:cholesterol oxidase
MAHRLSPGAVAPPVFDFVVIGSGFGGSVSAMRLAQKGYRVLVLERGRRFRDQELPQSSWRLTRYLWAPAVRCYGILEISPFRDVLVLHGSGVGGGSLGYANVLMEPDERSFTAPAWRELADWRSLLRPHYATARRMLGVVRNPRWSPADEVLREIAARWGVAGSFRPTEVGTFFGEPGREGVEIPDPFFGGEGPSRQGCRHCGGCLIGCRYNAKNTLPKNYLYFAERWGAEIRPLVAVEDILPRGGDGADGARFELRTRRVGSWWPRGGGSSTVRARNVVVAAGTLGTLRLLLRCRDVTRSLPALSPRLGHGVRTNSEALLGSVSRDSSVDYSQGIAITSIFQPDEATSVEPVRYPAGSSLMRFLSGPAVTGGGFFVRLAKSLIEILRRPGDFFRTHLLPRWAQRTTIVLVMQTVDSRLRFRLGRSWFTLFRRGLVSEPDPGSPRPGRIELAHRVNRAFAEQTNGIPLGSINEGLLDIPMTAHILGGCPFGRSGEDGVVDLNCQVHGYPGLYVVDGSIVPANPGVNPSLTIAAMAEYAMIGVPAKPGAEVRRDPLGRAAG